jgi:wobble nucleotide-excising tRNase
LGIDSFTIEKEGNFSYKIKRGEKNSAKFKTLSEGEKTIISFLYFLELCKGKESEDETVTEKIIVIDDPISSLSHIYIFNIAQLIKNTFLNNNYKQIFVLTHSLYFFHELWRYVKEEKRQLFRIIKSNIGVSEIKYLKPDEIQNEYQSYWQVLKDHNNGDSSDSLLANSMRNILEYFFEFIDKNKLGESINQIEKQSEYQFFVRYIQRESHSDSVNITDMKEIDPNIFKKAFKDIFEKAGHGDHYNKMIN